jgi:cbb3-type cytochrome oxidase subunit 3
MNEQKDQRLWQIAKKRAGFKQNLITYVFVNIFLWGVWWLTGAKLEENDNFPWPVWVTAIWGLVVVLNFFEAYRGGDKHSMAEEEYEKLKRKQDHL